MVPLSLRNDSLFCLEGSGGARLGERGANYFCSPVYKCPEIRRFFPEIRPEIPEISEIRLEIIEI